mmetsp:Transcript_11794/g.33997  ORF Transcript_11794/g.33997 Transcript_11794/m.33997 type:complete len:229 (-) Transcript_11794:3402-4088(-)
MRHGPPKIGNEFHLVAVRQAIWELQKEGVGWMHRDDREFPHCQGLERRRAQHFGDRRVHKDGVIRISQRGMIHASWERCRNWLAAQLVQRLRNVVGEIGNLHLGLVHFLLGQCLDGIQLARVGSHGLFVETAQRHAEILQQLVQLSAGARWKFPHRSLGIVRDGLQRLHQVITGFLGLERDLPKSFLGVGCPRLDPVIGLVVEIFRVVSQLIKLAFSLIQLRFGRHLN